MCSEIENIHSKEEYTRFRRQLLKRKESNGNILCGSFAELPFEYVLANPTDADKLCWIKIASQGHISDSLIVDTRDCHAGFARLLKPNNLQKNEKTSYYPRPLETSHEDVHTKGPAWRKFLDIHSSDVFLRLFADCHQKLMVKQHFKVDFVYSVYCPSWPKEAAEWITRDRANGWPPKDVIDDIVALGCHLVSKPHQSNPDDDIQWRFSFSLAEVILINSWSAVQKYIYHVLRLIKSDIVEQCGGEANTVL